MWDKAFTASLVAYAISSVVFLIGHYLLPTGSPVTLVGAALLGITGLSIGVSGAGLLLTLAFRVRVRR